MKIASDQIYLAYLFPVNFSYHVQTNHCHEQEETFLLLLRYVGQLIISTHAGIYGTPTHTPLQKIARWRVLSIIICLHGDPKHHLLGWEYTLYFLTLEIVTYLILLIHISFDMNKSDIHRKVRTFWEAYTFWKNLPQGFDIY